MSDPEFPNLSGVMGRLRQWVGTPSFLSVMALAVLFSWANYIKNERQDRLDDLCHNFTLYTQAWTDRTSVVYDRQHGDIGTAIRESGDLDIGLLSPSTLAIPPDQAALEELGVLLQREDDFVTKNVISSPAYNAISHTLYEMEKACWAARPID